MVTFNHNNQDHENVTLFSLISTKDVSVLHRETLDLLPEQCLILNYLSLGLSEEQIAYTLNTELDSIKAQCLSILKKISQSHTIQNSALNYQIRIRAHLVSSDQSHYD